MLIIIGGLCLFIDFVKVFVFGVDGVVILNSVM